MGYESSVRFLGLPLVHLATGRMENGRYRRGIARGWVAVGDIAFGGLVAVGGVAVGTISIGGLALGGLTLAGLSLGLAAVGGLAAGFVALGGAAFGWAAATGGLAVAREFALGGAAMGAHANDAAARAFFQQPPVSVALTTLREALVVASGPHPDPCRPAFRAGDSPNIARPCHLTRACSRRAGWA
jgi:hypothetical protein